MEYIDHCRDYFDFPADLFSSACEMEALITLRLIEINEVRGCKVYEGPYAKLNENKFKALLTRKNPYIYILQRVENNVCHYMMYLGNTPNP